MSTEAQRARRFNRLYRVKGDGVAEMRLQNAARDKRFKATIRKLAAMELRAAESREDESVDYA